MLDGVMTTTSFLMTRLPFLMIFAFLAICAFLYYRQERLIFLPRALEGFETPDQNPSGLQSPQEYEIDYDDRYVRSADGTRLHTWFMKQTNASSVPTIMFFQGNAGNMGFRLPNLVELFRILKVNIIAVSCRGYGYSEGTPTEEGVHMDAAAVLQYYSDSFSDELDIKKIFLFGRSLGGAVAVRLAHDLPGMVAGVMVENTFYSMEEEILHLMPPFRWCRALLKGLLRARFDTASLVGNLKVPALFISGSDDTLVPPDHLQRLYDECGSPMKWLLRVMGGTHNDTWQLLPRSYYKHLNDFITAVVEGTQEHRILQIPTKVDAGGKTLVRPPRFYETLLRQRRSMEQQPIARIS